MNASDKLLIFNKLYADNRERFIRFAHSYTHDLPAAEDITSDAFLSFWENMDHLSPDANFPAYILTVIKNNCLNHLRHVRISETVAEDMQNHSEWLLQTRISTLEACDPEELFGAEVKDIINRTLKSMSGQTRRIFAMNRFQNKTYNEIAIQTNMTVKGVEFHISKALKLLKNNLKDYFPVFFITFF